MKRNGQWMKGKSAETFGPLGPWLVTTDEIPDPHSLAMELQVNGEVRQKGSTSTMIFSIPFLLAYITQFCVLEPGDVVTTGTPPGVGSGMKPPQYLKAGDVMELAIEGLGTQRQTVVPFPGVIAAPPAQRSGDFGHVGDLGRHRRRTIGERPARPPRSPCPRSR